MLWIEIQTIIFLLSNCIAHSSQEHDYSDVQKYKQSYESNEPLNYRRINSADERNCKCTCKKCDKPKRCCKKKCTRCRIEPHQVEPYQVPASLVMIPFPMPFFVYPIKNTTESHQTTATTTTTTTVTSSTTVTSTIDESVTIEDVPESEENFSFDFDRPPKGIVELEREKYKNFLKKHRDQLRTSYSKEIACSSLAHCFSNLKSWKDNYYESLKRKRRKLEIMNNMRPTIDIRSKATPLRKMPKYGLVNMKEYVKN